MFLNKPRVMTPCRGECILSPDQICHGCKRTLHEISIWYKSDDKARLEIIKNCEERKKEKDIAYCGCCGAEKINGVGECYTDCMWYEGDKPRDFNPH